MKNHIFVIEWKVNSKRFEPIDYEDTLINAEKEMDKSYPNTGLSLTCQYKKRINEQKLSTC